MLAASYVEKRLIETLCPQLEIMETLVTSGRRLAFKVSSMNTSMRNIGDIVDYSGQGKLLRISSQTHPQIYFSSERFLTLFLCGRYLEMDGEKVSTITFCDIRKFLPLIYEFIRDSNGWLHTNIESDDLFANVVLI
jgi:hypothetical protein